MTTTDTSAARMIAELIHGHGVSHVFFVPAILREGLAELANLDVRPMSTHSEKAAAYMADGYARAVGRPGVCMAQTVGAANIAAGLKDAYLSCSPVIAFTGGTAPDTRYRQVYQQIRDFDMFEAVTKWNAEVESPARLPDIVAQAFRAATTGAPGPVHVELRGNTGQVGVSGESLPFALNVDRRFGEVPPFRPVADASLIRQALQALTSAERPVIVAGGGVMWSRAEAELVELAEKLSIPVATSLHAKATIAESNPLNVGVCGTYSRECANRVVAEADLVFFVGSQTGSMITTNWQVPRPGTRIVHLDIDGAQLGRHYPTEVPLNGDARATLRQMLAEASGRSNPRWLDRVRLVVQQWRDEVEDKLETNEGPIRPERIVTEIGSVLPTDGAAVIDTLQASFWSGMHMPLKGSTQRFIRCAGSLGWGFPAAIGAKCALGSRPVVCFTGDGGFYYHLPELETAARYQVPVVVVVNNNGSYGADRGPGRNPNSIGPAQEADLSWRFSGQKNFAQIAKELGCDGVRIERPTDLGPALQRALAAGKPVLLDVLTDATASYPRAWTPAEAVHA
ncbi:MAG: thiamine pyrophosphate-binding protein [Chloroflexi bacterium]|nr:thiamine pyrophosphate-binding protein [Chloroflexota bacterium]